MIGKKNHIVLCADKNYIKYIPAVIESVILNSGKVYEFNIITDLDKSERESYGFTHLDVDVNWYEIDETQFYNFKEVAHFTRAMYYRLLIPELIDSDKVLYLDCDVLVRGSLDLLFTLDINEYYVAAATNPFFNRHEILGLNQYNGYFNSGVMLINTKKWRDENIVNEIIHILDNNQDILLMPDQDALNMAFQGVWYDFGLQYNLQHSVLTNITKFSNAQYMKAISEPVIVHFSGTHKQWHYSCGNKYRYEYLNLENAISEYRRGPVADHLIRYFNRYKEIFYRRINK